jgi:hypothetical protein
MSWLVFFSLCFATFSANSKDQADPAEQLLNIEIAAYQLSSAFSAYVQFNGAPKFSSQLEDSIAAGKKTFNKTKEDYPSILNKWQQSLDFINDSKDLVFAGDDYRLVTGHAIYQNQLYKLIDTAQLKALPNASKQVSAQYEYLNTRVAFERVIAQYISFTGSATGFIHSDISIEESVKAFSKQVEKITNKNADFQRLNKKWNFIKGNMIVGSSQTTPFITLHTAADIRKTLQRIYKSERITSNSF